MCCILNRQNDLLWAMVSLWMRHPGGLKQLWIWSCEKLKLNSCPTFCLIWASPFRSFLSKCQSTIINVTTSVHNVAASSFYELYSSFVFNELLWFKCGFYFLFSWRVFIFLFSCISLFFQFKYKKRLYCALKNCVFNTIF